MKSVVENVIPLSEIQVPPQYLTIEIPSWEAVAMPLVYQVAKQFNPDGDPDFILLDEHVAALDLPNVASVAQLKQYAMMLFRKHQVHQKFYQELLPYLLVFFAETSQVILNSAELAEFQQQYQERLQQAAEAEGESLAEYVKRTMGIAETELEQQLAEHSSEDFIYKLIAQRAYLTSGHTLDELAYEQFIATNVLQRGADDIEIREQFPYESFKEWMPEMVFTQELFDYFEPQFKFVIAHNEIE